MEFSKVSFTPELRRLRQSGEADKMEEMLKSKGINYKVIVHPNDFVRQAIIASPELVTPLGEFDGIEGVKEYVSLITSTLE